MLFRSSRDNLEMIANQNILEKVVDIRSKFANDPDIETSTRIIINELNKLPGHEDIINKMILANAAEIDAIVKSVIAASL